MLRSFILSNSLKSVQSYWKKSYSLPHIFPASSKWQVLLIFLFQVYTAYNVYHPENTQVLHFAD